MRHHPKGRPLDATRIRRKLSKYDAIIDGESSAQKFTPCTPEQSLYAEYQRNHYQREMDLALEAVQTLYPNNFSIFEQEIMSGNNMATCNLLIAKRPIFMEYSEWLFNILFYAQARNDVNQYDAYNRRVYGFLAERLQRTFFVCRGYTTTYTNVDDAGNYKTDEEIEQEDLE